MHMTTDVVYAGWCSSKFHSGCMGVVRQALSWILDRSCPDAFVL